MLIPSEVRLSSFQSCPKCRSTDVKWGVSRGKVLADILMCTRCNQRIAIEDWATPIVPLAQQACCNCGHARRYGECRVCGLSADEDEQVHHELRDLIEVGGDFLSTARKANKIGRRLLALKLATAAIIYGPKERAEAARALRVWLLSAVGELQAAHDDAKQWVQDSERPSQLAWGSLGQQCENIGQIRDAADAYGNALKADPNQHLIRCRKARLLLQQNREGQAMTEILIVCRTTREDKFLRAVAPIAASLLDVLEARENNEECARLLNHLTAAIPHSPELLGHAARINFIAGNKREAKQHLNRAKALAPNLPIYARVEKLMDPSQRSRRKW